ncbi:MAG TPA: DsrH/TusB family sulfur metabolism protein [Tepiditoga sp.]|nr:sulfur relay protein DsrH [Thermotogota bacterium]HOO74977.1 DsrH/TusB family sulfur metabolism protein [Tepiditoga sp.]
MALFLIKYGTDNSAEKIKLKNTNDDDVLIFIQNGVYWTINSEINNIKGKKFTLKSDFISRGYQESSSLTDLIDYSQFIDIIEENEKIIG